MRLARRHHLMMIEIAELAGVPTGRMAKMPALALVETTSALARATPEGASTGDGRPGWLDVVDGSRSGWGNRAEGLVRWLSTGSSLIFGSP
jgi:hypothetical protein